MGKPTRSLSSKLSKSVTFHLAVDTTVWWRRRAITMFLEQKLPKAFSSTSLVVDTCIYLRQIPKCQALSPSLFLFLYLERPFKLIIPMKLIWVLACSAFSSSWLVFRIKLQCPLQLPVEIDYQKSVTQFSFVNYIFNSRLTKRSDSFQFYDHIISRIIDIMHWTIEIPPHLFLLIYNCTRHSNTESRES